MTEQPVAETAPQDHAAATPDDTPDTPPEVDWKSMSRTWEKRAKENADAAARLAEIENASKTEAQKAAEALEQTRQEAAGAKAQLLRYEVATEKGIPPTLVRFLTGDTREDIEDAAAALLEAIPGAPGSPPRAPTEVTQSVAAALSGQQPAVDMNTWMRTRPSA